MRFDFETGDLQGWEVVAGFIDPDTGSKALLQARSQPDSKLGRFSLATNALRRLYRVGEWTPWTRWAGTVESPVFVLEGSDASFLLGGSSAPPGPSTAWLALCTEDGREVRRAAPRTTDLALHRWERGALVGQRVFLRLVDRPGNEGFIALDAFEASGRIDQQATQRRRHDLERSKIEALRQVRQEFSRVGDIVFVASAAGTCVPTARTKPPVVCRDRQAAEQHLLAFVPRVPP